MGNVAVFTVKQVQAESELLKDEVLYLQWLLGEAPDVPLKYSAPERVRSVLANELEQKLDAQARFSAAYMKVMESLPDMEVEVADSE